MSVVSMRELLEAGVHFGHQTRRWNPKMRRFIFTERGGIYIIDLQQTLDLTEQAYAFARNVSERGGSILFVGTKKQCQDSVAEEAARVGMPYVNHRWLGGLLTNWRTISERIARLHELRRLRDEDQLDLLPSKERISMMAELEKLEINLGGVADMKSVPDAVFVVDLRKEQLAVREARRLGLPVIALVDTNCDPDDADYVIPGNDDAIRSCSLIVKAIANAIEAGKTKVTVEEMEEHRSPGRGRRAGAGAGAGRGGRRGRAGAIRGPCGRWRAGPVSTTEIPAALVKELRDLTGAGMMDCKRALVESDGDLEAARQALREKGLAEAGKRAGRETSEGKVVAHVDDRSGAIAALGCETEPVSGNEEFLAFAQHLLDLVRAEGAGAADSLEDERVELVAKLGENIVVVGAERFEADEGEVVADYIHPPAQKIGVLVHARSTPELARMVAMHIAAAKPRLPEPRRGARTPKSPRSGAIYEKLPEVESKPEDVRPQDRRGHARQAVLRGDRPARPGVGARPEPHGRPGARRARRRGAWRSCATTSAASERGARERASSRRSEAAPPSGASS